MADINDILMQMQAEGVDPSLADLSTDFLGAMQKTDMSYLSPQYELAMSAAAPQARVGGKPVGSLFNAQDFGMSVSSTDLQNLSFTIQNLSTTVERVIGQVQQTTQQSSQSIQSLAQLQAQTQRQISQQQMSMTKAQMFQPEMFPGAPSFAYQTTPSAAAFRTPMPSGAQVIAQRPAPSFMTDIMLTNPALNQFYEPSFAEDPFQSIMGANQRMQERKLSVKKGVTSFGTQLGASAVGWTAAKALGKFAFGASAGLPFALADTALDLMGLPSISGTIGAGAQMAYDATIGRQFTNLDMSRDVQKMTSFFTGPNASITGQGLNMGAASRVTSGIRGMAAQDFTMKASDYMGIFQASAEQGLLSQAANEEDMLKTVRSVSKNLRLFMRVSGDPDYKNAIKSMGDLYRMGVGINELSGAAQNVQNFSRMAGVSQQAAATFGQQGALIFQQAGANMGVGYQTGVMSRAMARTAAQNKSFSPGLLALMGGEEGLAQSMTEISGAFLGGPMNRTLISGLMERGEGGNLQISQEKVNRMLSGEANLEDVLSEGNKFLRGSRNRRDYMDRADELQQNLATHLGPQGIPTAIGRLALQQMEERDYSYQEALTTIIGRKQARQFERVYSPENVQKMIQSKQHQVRIQEFNRDKVVRSQNTLPSRGVMYVKDLFYDAIGRDIDLSSEEEAIRLENETREETGLAPIGMEERVLKGMSAKEQGAARKYLKLDTGIIRNALLREGERSRKVIKRVGLLRDYSKKDLESVLERMDMEGIPTKAIQAGVDFISGIERYHDVDVETLQEFKKKVSPFIPEGASDYESSVFFSEVLTRIKDKSKKRGDQDILDNIDKITEFRNRETTRISEAVKEKQEFIDIPIPGRGGFRRIRRDRKEASPRKTSAALKFYSEVISDPQVAKLLDTPGLSADDRNALQDSIVRLRTGDESAREVANTILTKVGKSSEDIPFVWNKKALAEKVENLKAADVSSADISTLARMGMARAGVGGLVISDPTKRDMVSKYLKSYERGEISSVELKRKMGELQDRPGEDESTRQFREAFSQIRNRLGAQGTDELGQPISSEAAPITMREKATLLDDIRAIRDATAGARSDTTTKWLQDATARSTKDSKNATESGNNAEKVLDSQKNKGL